jgi:8-oxo-dGTP pyrophosphatase MutT (NUDIX family)
VTITSQITSATPRQDPSSIIQQGVTMSVIAQTKPIKQITITTFGYLHGEPPPTADLIVDLREHFRDPHVDPSLRELTAQDAEVFDTVMETPGVHPLTLALAAAAHAFHRGPSIKPVNIAVGCAGGRHRSAAVGIALAEHLDLIYGLRAEVCHRDMSRPVVERWVCDNASVGVLLLDEDGRLLTFTRPDGAGVAPPAGHVFDEHTTFSEAARAEVAEEVGLTVQELTLVTQGWRFNRCQGGDGPRGRGHDWRIYRATWTGMVSPSAQETIDVRWRDRAELQALADRTVAYARYRAQVDGEEGSWSTDPGIEPVWVRWLVDADLITMSSEDLAEVEVLIETMANAGEENDSVTSEPVICIGCNRRIVPGEKYVAYTRHVEEIQPDPAGRADTVIVHEAHFLDAFHLACEAASRSSAPLIPTSAG